MTTTALALALDDLGRRQHGVVTREDLLRRDLDPKDIDRALHRRQLVNVHPGVMIAGGVAVRWPSKAYADYRYLERQLRRKRKSGAAMPAVALTGVAELALRGIGDIRPPEVPLLVTNPMSRSKRVLHVHREGLHHGLLEQVQGFATTGIAWSLAESSDVLPTVTMENTVVTLVRAGEVSVDELAAAAHELGWEIGVRLRQLLRGLTADDLRTRSGRERRVLRALATRGVEPPEVNVPLVLSGYHQEVDMLWRQARLIVEIDGPHHELPGQRRRDTRRDELAEEAGLHLERFTMNDVDHHLDAVIDRIQGLLVERSHSPDGVRATWVGVER